MRRSLALLLAGFALPTARASADDVAKLGGRVSEISVRVQDLERNLRSPTEDSGPEAAERRMIDAQVLYELKNYESAAIILLDIVQRFPNSRVYSDALYFLADSLYYARDFLSARRYFEKIVDIGPSNARYPDALQRLIEISLYVKDFAKVDGYVESLATVPGARQLPTLPYVKGKYLYFRQRYTQALAALRDIPADHPYWFRAQYLIGAALVAQGNTKDAIPVFESIQKAEVKTESHKAVVDLAHMALGRIHYESGDATRANTEYSKVTTKSDLYSDALYEQAWVAIKGKQFRLAFNALDLVSTIRPDHAQIPEIRLLMGNLQLRDGEWIPATESFSKTREEFTPIHQQIQEVITQHANLPGYFQGLISKSLGSFDASSLVPPSAAKWVKDLPGLGQVTTLVTDVRDLRRSIDEAEEILRRLDKAVSSPQRVNIFPEFARARVASLQAANELGDVRKKLGDAEREIERPVSTPVERSKLDEFTSQRQKLEVQLANIPRSADSYVTRLEKVRALFDGVSRRLSEVNVALASLSAERVAVVKFFRDTNRDGRADEQFRKEMGTILQNEDELRKEYDGIRRDLEDSIQAVGVDDEQMQHEAAIRAELAKVVTLEHELFVSIRSRLNTNDRTRIDQIESILDRTQAAERSLIDFNHRLTQQLDERLRDIKVKLAEERAHLAEYRPQVDGYAGETAAVGGGLTAENFRKVAERFYNIVVRSDIGIIDVGWALKQNRTDENARLVRQQKRELKLLDDEFRNVLRE